MNSTMLKVGITGGIGSGKSYICEVFKKLGVPTYSADLAARTLSNTSPKIIKNITDLFGKEAYKHKQLNRPFIASLVFNNPGKLSQLNSIIHPAVELDFSDWCTKFKNKSYVLKEAAILFETGIYKKLDKVIVVSAPQDLRIKRIMDRDNLSEKEIRSKMKNQWSTDKISSLADFIIENDGKQLILPQVIKVDNILG